MKKSISLIGFLSLAFGVFSQNIEISFNPVDAKATIDSVVVTNLNTGEKVKITGNETLILVKTTSIVSQMETEQTGIVYPNPCSQEANIIFSTATSQNVKLRVYNASGQMIASKLQSLPQGAHHFQLKFPITGIYYVSVLKKESIQNLKIIYSGSPNQSSTILFVGSEEQNLNAAKSQLKSAQIGLTLNYSEGDNIQYAIFSGTNATILTDSPTQSKVYDIPFYDCVDADNNSYKVVKIGEQIWMAENLKVGKLVQGDGNTNQIDNNIIEKYCYENISENLNKYGGMYQWDEMMQYEGEGSPRVKGVCPNGWHIPSKTEWMTLVDFAGGKDIAGSKLKSVSGWNNSGNGIDEFGFNALPSGLYAWDGTQPPALKFMGMGDYSVFYTSTSIDHMVTYAGFSFDSNSSILGDWEFWGYGLCVRCILDSETSSTQIPPIADFTASTSMPTVGQSIAFTDKSTNTPTSWLWDFGDGTNSTLQNSSHTYTDAGTFLVALEVTNSYGSSVKTINISVSESENPHESSSYTDQRDGKVYKTVKIGEQIWMAENLAYLPMVFPSDDVSSTESRYYVYDYQGADASAAKQTASYTTYGVLYNWEAAKSASPVGWHLPTDEEWKQLEMALGMAQEQADGVRWRGTDQGMQMKATSGWNNDGNGTNASSFSALPGGWCDTSFNEGGSSLIWWSKSEGDDPVLAWIRSLRYNNNKVWRTQSNKSGGNSVRCIKD